MKKIFLTLFMVVYSVFSYGQASSARHSIFVSYRVLSADNNDLDKVKMGLIDLFLFPENKNKTGSINLGYNYAISKNIFIGVCYTFQSNKADYRLPNANVIDHKRQYYHHIIMPTFKYSWLHLNYLSLYSKVSGGSDLKSLRITHENNQSISDSQEKSSSFAWQVSPIGVELGKNRYSAFLELGIGAMGILQLGLNFKIL